MKRRTFVKAAAAGVPSFGILSSVARAQSKEIRMIEAGGLSGDSIQVGYIDPLKAKTTLQDVGKTNLAVRKNTQVSRAIKIAARLPSIITSPRGL